MQEPAFAATGRQTGFEIGNSPIVSLSSSGQEGKDFKVVLRIDHPPTTLRPGMSCDADITTKVLRARSRSCRRSGLAGSSAGRRPPEPSWRGPGGPTSSPTAAGAPTRPPA